MRKFTIHTGLFWMDTMKKPFEDFRDFSNFVIHEIQARRAMHLGWELAFKCESGVLRRIRGIFVVDYNYFSCQLHCLKGATIWTLRARTMSSNCQHWPRETARSLQGNAVLFYSTIYNLEQKNSERTRYAANCLSSELLILGTS